jgi:primosomal protein N'
VHTKLCSLGVPAADIAFIHDYDTDEKKESLFRKVRRGAVRILIGSTHKMELAPMCSDF